MRQSETINELAKSLALAQGEVENASKDGENPHFRSQYATLASAWNAMREPFTKHGLSIIQVSGIEGEQLILTTRLMHASGQYVEGDYPVCLIGTDPQKSGSAMTYARRYTLMAIGGIAPEDDDGNEASGRQNGSKAAQKEVLDRKLEEARMEATQRQRLPLGDDFLARLPTATRAQLMEAVTKLITEQIPQIFSTEEGAQVIHDAKARFGGKSFKDLTDDQARELAKILYASVSVKQKMKLRPEEESFPPDTLILLWEEMIDISSTVKVFQRLRDELSTLVGEIAAEKIYRAALQKQGCTHSNQFKGDKTKGARPALKEIFEHLGIAKRQKAEQITDDDVPR